LAVFAAANALAAWFGAVGLATGMLDLGTAGESRLPFASPVLAGSALAAFVAVPLTVLAVAAWRGSQLADAAAICAGGLLVVWISGQLAILRTFSWFQPVYALIGIGLIVVGTVPATRRRATGPRSLAEWIRR
jgi:hypothetical protein